LTSDSPAKPCSVENISIRELEEIRSLKHPPLVVQRALEVVCLLLSVVHFSRDLKPPDWSTVQHMLTDTKFLTRVLMYDVTALRAAPELVDYIRNEYFASRPVSVAGQVSLHDALSFERVFRANCATAALFRWGSFIITSAEAVPPVIAYPVVEPSVVELEPEIKVTEAIVADVTLDVLMPVPEPSRLQLRPDRHFETVVPSLAYSMSTSITMEVIEEVVLSRPDLRLELSACVDPIEGSHKTMDRLHNVLMFLAAKGIKCQLKAGMAKASATREAGITCAVHLNGDAPLILFLRKLEDLRKRSLDHGEFVDGLNPEEEQLNATIERLEEWFTTRMHF